MDESTPAPTTTHVDYYREIVASLSSGVIALDQDARIIAANQAACTHLGVEPQQLAVGLHVDELQLPGPFREVLRSVLTTHETVSRLEIELEPQPQAGETGNKFIGVTASLLGTPDDFNGAIFLFADMTERRALEHAAELNRQLAQIGQLTAGVVHELRNPLSVISGTAELIQRKLDDDDPSQKLLKSILQESELLRKSIAQFLSFAKPFTLEQASCLLGPVIDRAITLSKAHASQKGVVVDTRLDPGLPPVRLDAEKTAQALANLINNAIDAVSCPEGQVQVNASKEGQAITIDILDNGPGVNVPPGKDIFNPFYSNKEGGTGLGLAICHRIITAHGGTITYRNIEPSGACFSIRLPQA